MSRLIHRGQPACAEREEDLLLYLHGELPPMARFRVGRHLRRCPQCQQRFASLASTSQALADTIRGSALPPWTPPLQPASRLAYLGGSLTLLLLALISVVSTLWIRHVQASAPAPLAAVPRSATLRCEDLAEKAQTPTSRTSCSSPQGMQEAIARAEASAEAMRRARMAEAAEKRE